MTLDELDELCQNEWKKALGTVTEIHLTDDEYAELKDTLFAQKYEYGLKFYPSRSDIVEVANAATGTFIKIVRLRNKAVVKRPLLVTPPDYEVLIPSDGEAA